MHSKQESSLWIRFQQKTITPADFVCLSSTVDKIWKEWFLLNRNIFPTVRKRICAMLLACCQRCTRQNALCT